MSKLVLRIAEEIFKSNPGLLRAAQPPAELRTVFESRLHDHPAANEARARVILESLIEVADMMIADATELVDRAAEAEAPDQLRVASFLLRDQWRLEMNAVRHSMRTSFLPEG